MKVTCCECGAAILPDTAARNGGLCAPCNNGTRHSLEAARVQRETEEFDPFQVLFRRVRDQTGTHGFTKLSHSEATYYAVASLFSDLNRGAVQLFFNVNCPEFRKAAADGLATLGRGDLLIRLDEAGKLCAEQETWYSTERNEDDEPPHEDRLSCITHNLLDASDDIRVRLECFAVEQGLVSKRAAP